MICATANADGYLILDTTVSDVSSCTYTVMTGTEAASLVASPFNLTLEQGGLLAGAILSCWVAAWLCRVFLRQFSSNSSE